MPTIRVSPDHPDRDVLQQAAAVLRSGGLVAFPTETVYGLGAHALDEAAVRRIYAAKGRPPLNPLIVHVSSVEMARTLARAWPERADRLASALWPGPLTLVVPRSEGVPDVVTAGGATVGLRMPAHPVALALIDLAGVPVAAPSANRSNEISPTTAAHVERSLGDRVDLIVDGGATSVGIESTVVDITAPRARVLRPGMITADAIARALGGPRGAVEAGPSPSGEAPRSPGMLGKHYAPRGRVVLFASAEREEAADLARAELSAGRAVGAMVFTSLGTPGLLERQMAGDAGEYARQLYATLHLLDGAGSVLILVERPPATEEWRGVIDRLERTTL